MVDRNCRKTKFLTFYTRTKHQWPLDTRKVTITWCSNESLCWHIIVCIHHMQPTQLHFVLFPFEMLKIHFTRFLSSGPSPEIEEKMRIDKRQDEQKNVDNVFKISNVTEWNDRRRSRRRLRWWWWCWRWSVQWNKWFNQLKHVDMRCHSFE